MIAYSEEQLNLLLNTIDDYEGWQFRDDSYYKDRDKILIKMAYYLGMREEEVSTASVIFLDKVNKLYTVPKGVSKNHRPRPMPIPELFFNELINYIRKYNLNNWLFLSRSRGFHKAKDNKKFSQNLCPRAIGFRFQKYRKLAGLDMIKDFSKDGRALRRMRYHDLRSTYATRLDKAGVRLKVIQNLLGHLHLSSTERYLSNSTIEERREAVNLVFS